MLSLRLFGKEDIRIVETEIPQISDDEILLKTSAAAICGTDVRMWQNGQNGVDSEHPLTLGHEFSGVIAKVGANVSFYHEGMFVSMQPNIGCGICDRCVSGKFHLCEDYRAFGINMDGAMAEYIKIPANAVLRGNLTLIPKGITAANAAIAEPISCAYNGIEKCAVRPGEIALVIGAGPIGYCHAMLLHMAGAIVIMNDISQERLNIIKEKLPFIETCCGNELAAYVKQRTQDKGVDIAITACPVPSVQTAVISLMNYGGRVNFFGGIPASKEPVSLDTNLVHYKELILTGSTRSSISQYRKTMEFIAQGLLNVDDMITDTYKLCDGKQAFENAKSAKGLKHVIVFE